MVWVGFMILYVGKVWGNSLLFYIVTNSFTKSKSVSQVTKIHFYILGYIYRCIYLYIYL